ncbi:MAG: dihydroorotase [Treponema sp.]|jgi:dihydroorotase|nr:dihydroorotase [Treponema sp.]
MLLLNNFRIVDEASDFTGSVIVEDGFISGVLDGAKAEQAPRRADTVIEGGGNLVLMPAFVDLHAHFRDPGTGDVCAKETMESACLAAAAGGYGTVACMANTQPPVDSIDRAASLKKHADALGLVDLYPVLSLTKGMEGKELSEITKLPEAPEKKPGFIRLLSEDGRDMAGDGLFLSAFTAARRAGLPVSCHCDLGGEYNAAGRAIEFAIRAGAKLHIAHVSTKETIELIRKTKSQASGFSLSCEITPHHLALTKKDVSDAAGKVAPPLGSGEDRLALVAALVDGTADAIATDHAPHTAADKASGAPGFSGLETAFCVCFSALVKTGTIDIKKLSSLMSAAPARILGLGEKGPRGRGLAAPGYRADLVIVDTGAARIVDPQAFKSRGKNSPFAGRMLCGTVLAAIHSGRVVFDGR